MRITLVLVFIVALAIGSWLMLRDFRSAFEADQACHFAQWENFKDSPEFGCDHDLETHQWLLYSVGSNHEPAKVLKRFRY